MGKKEVTLNLEDLLGVIFDRTDYIKVRKKGSVMRMGINLEDPGLTKNFIRRMFK